MNEKSKSQAQGFGEFVTEAYNLEDQESMTEFYAKWAEKYDAQMIDELEYISPETIATRLMEQVADRGARILDIGCGTGLTVSKLSDEGYNNLHGIDLSAEMVEVARSRNFYAGLQVGDVNQPLQYEDNCFDGVISSGTFTHGHVGPEPLDEICRILKPGGILACTVHQDLWQELGFEVKFDELTDAGSLIQLSLVHDKYYKSTEPEGWFCVYQKS